MGRLSKALGAIDRPHRGPRCGIAALLSDLEGTDREEFEATLSNASLMSSVLAKAISDAYGAQISQQTIGRHRRGACSCRG